MRCGSLAECFAWSRVLWLLVVLLPHPASAAERKPTFLRSQIDMEFSRFETADVNGDGLVDILLIAKDGLHIFPQDADKGFSLQRQVVWSPKDRAVALWPARIGPGKAAEVLVLTAKGLSSLRVDQDGVYEKSLIERETLIPAEAESAMVFFPLVVKTTSEWPLLLVPTTKALEIWRHNEDGWRQAGTIGQTPQTLVSPPWGGPGYNMYRFANIAVGDINSDGRDDLVAREATPQRDHLHLNVYLQDSSGMLPEEPALQYDTPFHWYEWVNLQDMNHDGRVDLVKNTWSRYPLVLPGTWSGKVIVRVHLADKTGNLPGDPTCIFRKHDWRASIPMVDLDGDGCTDLVMGFYQWKGRDQLVEAIETHRVPFDLRVYMLDPAKGYPAEPTFVTGLAAYVSTMDIDIDWDFLEDGYSVEGDFSGDGRKDLLIRHAKAEAFVRFFESRETGFSAEAQLRFSLNTDKWARLIPKDLNGDGISDLIVVPDDGASLIVFTSKATADKVAR